MENSSRLRFERPPWFIFGGLTLTNEGNIAATGKVKAALSLVSATDLGRSVAAATVLRPLKLIILLRRRQNGRGLDSFGNLPLGHAGSLNSAILMTEFGTDGMN